MHGWINLWFRFRGLHETGVSMIMGMLAGWVVDGMSSDEAPGSCNYTVDKAMDTGKKVTALACSWLCQRLFFFFTGTLVPFNLLGLSHVHAHVRVDVWAYGNMRTCLHDLTFANLAM